MSKRPLPAATSDNLLQPDTALCTGRNPSGLSGPGHPNPSATRPPFPTVIIIPVLNDTQVRRKVLRVDGSHVNNPCRREKDAACKMSVFISSSAFKTHPNLIVFMGQKGAFNRLWKYNHLSFHLATLFI